MFALWLASSLLGQSFTGSVNGLVTDESGAAVGAAKIVVTDRDRGTTFGSVADASGRFVVTALPPGNYSLIVEAVGFKRQTRYAPIKVRDFRLEDTLTSGWQRLCPPGRPSSSQIQAPSFGP